MARRINQISMNSSKPEIKFSHEIVIEEIEDLDTVEAPIIKNLRVPKALTFGTQWKSHKLIPVLVKKIKPVSFGKYVSYGLGILVLLVVVNKVIYVSSPTITLQSLPTKQSDMFTIVVNSFRRPEMLQKFVKHYSSCQKVESIRVVWSDQESPVPQPSLDEIFFSSSKKVIYHPQETDSLNNRFRPISDLNTDSVFAVDDDIIVPCKELDFAHEVWQNSKRTMVGFMPRTHTPYTKGSVLEYAYNCWWKVWWDGSFSMILTKAAFLHKDYLDSYTNRMPDKIRNYVDEKKNCEDIAMSFLVANETSLPPIYVRGNLKDYGVFNGISTTKWRKGGHMHERNECLNKLVEFYDGNMPLVKGQTIATPASSWAVNQPSTWLEYFSSDILIQLGKNSEFLNSQVRRSSASAGGIFGLLLTATLTL